MSAYEPVPEGRLRDERQQVPEDLQWMVNPREDVEETLKAGASSLEGQGVDVETLAREGDPADAILDVAEEKNADLIVVGNKGMTGAKRFLLGLGAEQGVSPRPVLGDDHPDDLREPQRGANMPPFATPLTAPASPGA